MKRILVNRYMYTEQYHTFYTNTDIIPRYCARGSSLNMDCSARRLERKRKLLSSNKSERPFTKVNRLDRKYGRLQDGKKKFR